jgi:DNA-binding LacI/PurR family transcriptional regulator
MMVELLLAQIDGRPAEGAHIVPTHLVRRGSA